MSNVSVGALATIELCGSAEARSEPAKAANGKSSPVDFIAVEVFLVGGSLRGRL